MVVVGVVVVTVAVTAALLVTGALVTSEGEPVVGEALDGELPDGEPLDGGGLLAGEDGGGEEEAGGSDVDVEGGAVDVGGPDVVELGGADVAPPDTLSSTYSPNRSSAPAGGSEAVTRASSDGAELPPYPTASPLLTSRCRASPNVVPARLGTVCRCRVSKTESRVPVVPTGRSIPRPGSAMSTRASRSSFCAAGRTVTTEDA
jgi:hypothetical protein